MSKSLKVVDDRSHKVIHKNYVAVYNYVIGGVTIIIIIAIVQVES